MFSMAGTTRLNASKQKSKKRSGFPVSPLPQEMTTDLDEDEIEGGILGVTKPVYLCSSAKRELSIS